MKKNKITDKQYEIMIASAEKVTDRRMNQNNVYTTLNLAFLSYVVTSKTNDTFTVLLCLIGLIMVINWFFTIKNYAKKNAIKFEIINEYEKDNGTLLFQNEYELTKKTKNFSFFEKVPVIVFGVIYIVVAMIAIF